MKILIDPLYTNRSLLRCATNFVFKKTAEYMLRELPGSSVYYVVPDTEYENNSFIIDDKFDIEGVVCRKQECYRDRYKEYFYLKRAWVDDFAFWGECYDWDVLLTARSTCIPMIRMLTEKSHSRPSRKVVIFDPLPLLDFKRTVDIGGDLRLQTLAGYMNSDLVAVNTGHERSGVLAAARELLSTAAISRLQEKLVVKYIAPIQREEKPDAKREWFIKTDPFKLVYTQRLDKSERRPEDAFDAMMYAFVTRDGIKTEAYTNTAAGIEDGDFVHWNDHKYSQIDMYQPKRQEFYEKLKVAHVFVSFSIEEGLPLSLYEAITHGVIGVVAREPWSEDMFGKDYPWLVSNPEEATHKIRWIKDNREQAYDMFLDWYWNKFKKTHDSRGDFLPFLRDRILEWEKSTKETIQEKHKNSDPENLTKIIIDYTKGRSGRVNLIELLKEMKKDGRLTMDFNRLERLDPFSVPLSRNTSLHKTVLELRHVYGWKGLPEPGELEIK